MSAGPPLPADLWDDLPPEARALILALRAEAAELRAEVQALQREIRKLQDQLNQNSTNSSRPPSSDPSASSSADQVGLPNRPYPSGPPATYVEAKLTGSDSGASGARSGRPACTTRLAGCRLDMPCIVPAARAADPAGRMGARVAG